MPYLRARVNRTVSEDETAQLRRKFGEAISLLPGKTERWLMVDIDGSASLSLAGDGSRPLAMLEVELYGKSTPDAYDALTARLTEILDEVLGVSPDGVYVKYAEVDHWGFAGSNF